MIALLPFTIKAWQSGLVPCTAGRLAVTQITEFYRGDGSLLCLGGIVGVVLHSWDPNGVHDEDERLNLRLRPKTEKRTVIFHRDESGHEWVLLKPAQDSARYEIASVEIEVPVP